jgi:dipeptide/tripeptide permease
VFTEAAEKVRSLFQFFFTTGYIKTGKSLFNANIKAIVSLKKPERQRRNDAKFLL